MAQIVTITNPLTGQPAQVDQLEHTAQEIDDAIARALPGGAIDITLANKLGGIESTEYPGCYYRMVSGVVEWVNPPMAPGVEYRTTERYKGKPVYIKAVDTGALPNATFKSVAASFPNANAIVDYGGEAYQDGDHFIPLPCLKYGVDSYNNEKGVQVTISNGYGIVIATMTDFSSFTSSSVWVKYTKSTD